MEHLIDIESLTKQDIENIMNLAKEFKNLYPSPLEGEGRGEGFTFNERLTKPGKGGIGAKTIALMFYENSTRTRCSFEIAAKKLGMNVINFDEAHSSLNKGESLKDTIENLYFLGVNAVVIRHSYSGIINNVMRLVKYPIKFINAGDGSHAHPTQALLDYYTMLEKTGGIADKKIAIIGDILHSRVAKSNIALLSKFGADIHVCAPSYLMFENLEAFNIKIHNDLKEAVSDADIVMALRVQNERHEKEGYPESSEYKRLYEIDTELLKKYASKDVILMHPGPANRNIEVSSRILDDTLGRTILEQAQNGVYVRMAVLNMLLEGGFAAGGADRINSNCSLSKGEGARRAGGGSNAA